MVDQGRNRRCSRRRFLTAATASTLALAGCGGSSDDSTPTAGTATGTPGSNGGSSVSSGFGERWASQVVEEDEFLDASDYRTAVGSDFLAVAVEFTLYGIDTSDGTVRWEYSNGGDIDALAVTDTHVFLHHSADTGPGDVYAVNQETGETDGQRGGVSERLPLVALDDYVIVPHEYQGFNEGLYIMETDGGLYGTLTEEEGANWVDGEGDAVVVGRSDPDGTHEVTGYDLTGEFGSEQAWNIPDLELYTTGVVDGTLVSPNGDAFTLLDVVTGDRTDISVEADFGSAGEVVVADGLAFHTDYRSETLYAVDPATEEVAWTLGEGLSDYTRTVSTGDAVVLRSADDFLAVDPATGETLARGGEPQEGAFTVEANGDAVYSCAETVTAYDVDFS